MTIEIQDMILTIIAGLLIGLIAFPIATWFGVLCVLVVAADQAYAIHRDYQ